MPCVPYSVLLTPFLSCRTFFESFRPPGGKYAAAAAAAAIAAAEAAAAGLPPPPPAPAPPSYGPETGFITVGVMVTLDYDEEDTHATERDTLERRPLPRGPLIVNASLAAQLSRTLLTPSAGLATAQLCGPNAKVGDPPCTFPVLLLSPAAPVAVISHFDLHPAVASAAAWGMALTGLILLVVPLGAALFACDVQRRVLRPMEALVRAVKHLGDDALLPRPAPVKPSPKDVAKGVVAVDASVAADDTAGKAAITAIVPSGSQAVETTMAVPHASTAVSSRHVDWTADPALRAAELQALLRSVGSMGALLRMGVGEHGARVLATQQTGAHELDPLAPGKRGLAIFGCVRLRLGAAIAAALGGEVIPLVNAVADIVHNVAASTRIGVHDDDASAGLSSPSAAKRKNRAQDAPQWPGSGTGLALHTDDSGDVTIRVVWPLPSPPSDASWPIASRGHGPIAGRQAGVAAADSAGAADVSSAVAAAARSATNSTNSSGDGAVQDLGTIGSGGSVASGSSNSSLFEDDTAAPAAAAVLRPGSSSATSAIAASLAAAPPAATRSAAPPANSWLSQQRAAGAVPAPSPGASKSTCVSPLASVAPAPLRGTAATLASSANVDAAASASAATRGVALPTEECCRAEPDPFCQSVAEVADAALGAAARILVELVQRSASIMGDGTSDSDSGAGVGAGAVDDTDGIADSMTHSAVPRATTTTGPLLSSSAQRRLHALLRGRGSPMSRGTGDASVPVSLADLVTVSLHAGWAVDTAVGSDRKLDTDSASPHARLAQILAAVPLTVAPYQGPAAAGSAGRCDGTGRGSFDSAAAVAVERTEHRHGDDAGEQDELRDAAGIVVSRAMYAILSPDTRGALCAASPAASAAYGDHGYRSSAVAAWQQEQANAVCMASPAAPSAAASGGTSALDHAFLRLTGCEVRAVPVGCSICTFLASLAAGATPAPVPVPAAAAAAAVASPASAQIARGLDASSLQVSALPLRMASGGKLCIPAAAARALLRPGCPPIGSIAAALLSGGCACPCPACSAPYVLPLGTILRAAAVAGADCGRGTDADSESASESESEPETETRSDDGEDGAAGDSSSVANAGAVAAAAAAAAAADGSISALSSPTVNPLAPSRSP